MSTRRVQVLLLCEDSQQEAFVRRFLKGMGWNPREIRPRKSPSAGGSAEQWVREEFPKELTIYRQRQHKAATILIAVIDADSKDVQQRVNEFEAECSSQDVQFRSDDEAVAFVIPKRNIETWIHYLQGEQVTEEDDYPKLSRERGCGPAVEKLVKLCRSMGLDQNAPPSLATACNEYATKIKSQRG